MSDPQNLAQRINELEALIAHQDQKLDDMSDTISGLWDKIDVLTRQAKQLGDRLASAEGDVHSLLPDDKPPPHY